MEIIGEQKAFETVGEEITEETVNGTVKKYTGELSAVVSKMASFTVGENGVASLHLKDDGGVGVLTVVKKNTASASGGGTSGNEPPETYEVQMAETKQPLAFHPSFPQDALSQWTLFLASPANIQCQQKYLACPSDENSQSLDLPGSLTDWATLYNKGIQDFVTYQPVVSATQTYETRPTPSGIGTKEDPPEFGSLATEWLKTADNISFDSTTRLWTRTRQWTGAHEWPDLLYGGSAS